MRSWSDSENQNSNRQALLAYFIIDIVHVLGSQVILNKENITVYQLAGFRLRFRPNYSDPTLRALASNDYTWTVDDLGKVSTYKWPGSAPTPEMFSAYYRTLVTPLVITKFHHSLIRYTIRRSNSGKYFSETAILRVGARPTISRQSDILSGTPGSTVEACFNVTGSPKPSLIIGKRDNSNDTVSSSSTQSGCIKIGPIKLSNAGNVTITAKNCFGKSKITIAITIVQSTSTTEILKTSSTTQFVSKGSTITSSSVQDRRVLVDSRATPFSNPVTTQSTSTTQSRATTTSSKTTQTGAKQRSNVTSSDPSPSPTTIYCSRNITQYEAHTTQLSTTNNIQAQQIQNYPTDVFGLAANTFILSYNGRAVASSESKIAVSVNSTLTMQYTVTNLHDKLHLCHNEKATDRVFDLYPFLIIPNVQQSDSGIYEIIARDRDVNTRLYFTLQVKTSPSTADTSATPPSQSVLELRDTSEKIEVLTTALIVVSVCIFVFALPTTFLVYKYRQLLNLLTRRLANSSEEETGEQRSPTYSNVEDVKQTAIFIKTEEAVSLVNPTANPTATCGDAVYESVEENQERQVTVESSQDIASDIAVQDNAAYGATV
ncbi:uncharacterized protein LOC134177657 [Corticium candelabrum]|uniref:uncharacterized protein LOC134177657 n=1 Tax=Corticium candelabrum TaxID=121492 RepID=UPI002E269AA3|nr:uncharacterized protein LOC134177657 [Corticium candelabrum]